MSENTTPPVPAATAQNVPEDLVEHNTKPPRDTVSLVGKSKRGRRKLPGPGPYLTHTTGHQLGTPESKRLHSWRKFLRNRLDTQPVHVGGDTTEIEWRKYRVLLWGKQTWKTNPVLLKEFIDLMELYVAQYKAFDNEACTRGSLKK
jgi:hypothetical protein